MDEQTAERLEGIGLRDHSVTAEYRIFGPPGTGKTTNLTHQIKRAADRFGDGSVLASSFSRATAAELVGRDTSTDSDRIGTLHSHCFHALGKPTIAEVNVGDWNRRYPRLKVTPVSRHARLDGEDASEDDGHAREGDVLLQRLNRCRGMMLSPESWPAVVRDFGSLWSRYKSANELLDFCDLIEVSMRNVPQAPHNPSVLVVDEAQDLNRMQLTLIRRWSDCAQYLVLAGDDDQTIYPWAGASPEAILDPEIPDDHKVFLKESVRVPRAIYAVAERLIRQVSRRQEKTYHPRPANGAVLRLSRAGYRSPEYWILKTAERHLAEGKTIMFLASCSYMLQPILAVLRKEGIPFHNPYRKANGFWNPLRMSSRQSAANRILSLLIAHVTFGSSHHRWRGDDLMLWTEWLPAQGVFTERGREIVAALPPVKEASSDILEAVFQPASLVGLLAALRSNAPSTLLEWWTNRVMPAFRKRIQFPVRIAARRGGLALVDSPRVIVGTIHSVKGGEADVVYLFPDLSKAGYTQYRQCGAPRDSVIRQFYVGVTRTRETLYLCSPASDSAISI